MKFVIFDSMNTAISKRFLHCYKRILIFTIIVVFSFGSAHPLTAQDPFFTGPLDIQPQRSEKPSTIRSRIATIDNTQFLMRDSGASSTSDINQVYLNLFKDVELTAIFENVTTNHDSSRSWIGHIDGEEGSQVIVVEMNGVIAASIATSVSSYQIRYAGNGIHIIEEVDTSLYPAEIEPIPIYTDDFDIGDIPTSGDTGCEIDILVFYTTAARIGAGGYSGISTRIQLGITETNLAYANSGITAQLNLKAMLQLDYNESGNFSTDLERLQSPSDGYLDSVHSLRNSYGADLVSLIVNTGDACGIAYRMCNVGPSFADWAFSVVREDCISPTYSFAHEIGHNMGCHHAPEDTQSGDCIAYNYSYGYKNYVSNFRTIMAYSPGARVLHFSNPGVSYLGNPTGSYQQNNALTINNSCSIVSNFRKKKKCLAKTAMEADIASNSKTKIKSTNALLKTYTSHNGELNRHTVGQTIDNKYTVNSNMLSKNSSLLDTMYEFRDEVMKKSTLGKEYIDMYYKHSGEASFLLLKDGDLRNDTYEVLSKFVPLFEKVIYGESIQLTEGDLTQVYNVLDTIATHGSDELQQTIDRVLSDISDQSILQQFGISIRKVAAPINRTTSTGILDPRFGDNGNDKVPDQADYNSVKFKTLGTLR